MDVEAKLTRERLLEVLNYDPLTGVFTWKAKTAKGTKIGSVAGSIDPNGYIYINIDKVGYLAQRLAWLYVKGEWPRLIRFQDRNRSNCRIDNLQEGFYLDTRHDHRTPEGKAAYQKEYRTQNPEKHRDLGYRKNFGIDLEEYQRLFLAQNGVCDICAKPETEMRSNKVKWMAVDHNHTTGAVRGLLCTACNKMIGLAGDSKETLAKAIKYLEKHEVADNVVPLFSEDQG